MLSLSSIRAMKGYERGVSDKLPGGGVSVQQASFPRGIPVFRSVFIQLSSSHCSGRAFHGPGATLLARGEVQIWVW